MRTNNKKSKSGRYPYSSLVEAEITIPFIDRIRILFGSRLFMNTVIYSKWAGDFDSKSLYKIERLTDKWRFWPERKSKASLRA